MNIVSKKNWFFAIAAILSVLSIIFLIVFKLTPGLDFSSGSLLTLHFDQTVEQSALRQELDTLGYQSATIQSTGSGDYVLHTQELDDAAKNQLVRDLSAKLGTSQQIAYDRVEKGDATTAMKNAIIAIIVSVAAMLLYIAWAFRKMPSPFRYGVSAVAGLAFDVLMALGIYSLLGKLMGWEVNLMFIAGILAVLGFSINNTIIVFDRIRENTARGISPDIAVVANHSIVQTLGRSFNSILTVLFTLVVLSLFVGSSIQNFVMVLLIGVVSGVFTSTCLSPEMLVAWQKRKAITTPVRPNVVSAKAKS
jgi:preprotein translocase subunit SecF